MYPIHYENFVSDVAVNPQMEDNACNWLETIALTK